MKIPNNVIEEAISWVQATVAGTPIAVQGEVQDDWEFILISAILPPESAEAKDLTLLLPYKEIILCKLETLIPPKPDGSYSWMVLFTINGKVVDVVMTGVPLE